MIPPRRLPSFRPFAARCFESVFLPMRNFRLGGIRFLDLPANLPTDRPVLLVANHVSNWDGFILRETQRRLRPDWPVFSVMMESESHRYPFFRLLGGIGIRPESPASVAGALRDVKSLRRRDPAFFLSYFPQGRIWPSFRKPLGFLPGVDLFLRALAPATVIPLGLHMEPMRGLAPTFFVSAGRPLRVDRPAPIHRILEDLVQGEVEKIHGLLSAHGEALPDPAPAPGVTRI